MKKIKSLFLAILIVIIIGNKSITVRSIGEDVGQDAIYFNNNNNTVTSEQAAKLWESINVAKKTLPFYLKGILSGDEQVAKTELNQEYIKYFDTTKKMFVANEKQAAKIFNIKIPFTENFDFFHHITNIIAKVIEGLEQVYSWLTVLVLTLYTLSVNNFFGKIIIDLFEYLNTSILGVGKIDGLITRIIVAVAVVTGMNGIIRNTQRAKSFSPKSVLHQIISYIINIAVVFLLLTTAPRIINQFSTNGMNWIGSVVIGSETNVEIETKKTMFDLLQKIPFYYRHFGTVEATKMPSKDEYTAVCSNKMLSLMSSSTDTTELQSGDQFMQELYTSSCNQQASKMNFENMTGEQIFQSFLENPSDKALLDIQTSTYSVIPNRDNIAFKLGDSIIFGIFRIILSGVLFLICITSIFIGIIYSATIYLSTYSLVFSINNPEKQAINWLMNRLMWSVFYSISLILFSVLIMMLTKIVKMLLGIHILFMFVFMLLLILLCYQLIKHPEILLKMFKSIFNTFVNGALHGQFTPQEMIVNAGKTLMKDGKTQIDKLLNKGNIENENEKLNETANKLNDDTLTKDYLSETYGDTNLKEHLSNFGINADNIDAMKNTAITTEQNEVLKTNPSYIKQQGKRYYRQSDRFNTFDPKNKLEAAEVIAYLYGITDQAPNVEKETQNVAETSTNQVIYEDAPKEEKALREVSKTALVNDEKTASPYDNVNYEVLNENVNLKQLITQLNNNYKTIQTTDNALEKDTIKKMIEGSRELFKEHHKEEVTLEIYHRKMQSKGIELAMLEKFQSSNETTIEK